MKHLSRVLLLAITLLSASNAPAQSVQMPEINAFLPKVVDVKPGEPSALDGLWTISSIDKNVRIDRGRIYAIDSWNHMLVLKVKPGMVVIKDVEEQDIGVYSGYDMPLTGEWRAELTGDRILDCRVGKARYQMIPQQLDDPEAFNKLFKQVRARESAQSEDDAS